MKTITKTVPLIISLGLACLSRAQNYAVVDLGPTSWAYAASGERAFGFTGSGASIRATMWDSTGAQTDVHPSFLDGATPGFSMIRGAGGTYWVGYGSGQPTGGRPMPILWENGVARLLPVGFASINGTANATDGTQVVGYAYASELVRDVATFGDAHAVLWTPSTGEFVDLYRGNPTYANGVGGGKQVGYELRGNRYEAQLWSGTARSAINLHPRNFDVSMANATDGVRQVGQVGVDTPYPGEHKRGRKVRFNYAFVWNGTAESGQMLGSFYAESYALGVAGDTIAGYCVRNDIWGRDLDQVATAWVGPLNELVDLGTFLPTGSSHSRATAVDAAGNVTGSALYPDGQVHGVLWVRL